MNKIFFAMKKLTQLQRIKKTHRLIQQADTGTPKEFATQLYISERTLYNCLEILKEWKAPISV